MSGIKRQRDEQWTCSACTFVNTNPDFLSCEICGTPKPLPDFAPPKKKRKLEEPNAENGVHILDLRNEEQEEKPDNDNSRVEELDPFNEEFLDDELTEDEEEPKAKPPPPVKKKPNPYEPGADPAPLPFGPAPMLPQMPFQAAPANFQFPPMPGAAPPAPGDNRLTTTVYGRKVFDVFKCESLLHAVAEEIEQTVDFLKGKVEEYLTNFAPSKEEMIRIPVMEEMADERAHLNALLALGVQIELFVAGDFVKSFSTGSDQYEDPVHVNRVFDPAGYQLFQWRKDLLSPTCKQMAQMMTDDVNQAGGDVPTKEMLAQTFQPHQIEIALKWCEEYHESNMRRIAGIKEQAERDKRCTMCRQEKPNLKKLRDCTEKMCIDCLKNWIETSWDDFEAKEGSGSSVCKITCLMCSKELNLEDIKDVHPKIGSAIEAQKAHEETLAKGGRKCYEKGCDEYFFPSEPRCAKGHRNCAECAVVHEGACPDNWEDHCPEGLMIVRRFMWMNPKDDPMEFKVLANRQKCTSNSIIGPKGYTTVAGVGMGFGGRHSCFGLINSVKKSVLIAGGPQNLGSGGQVAKNSMSHGQVLLGCNHGLSSLHAKYRSLYDNAAPRVHNHNRHRKYHRQYNKKELNVCETNLDLVKDIYKRWRSTASHNEILIDLDQTMVVGLWGSAEALGQLKDLQDRFMKKFGRKLRVYAASGRSAWNRVSDEELQNAPPPEEIPAGGPYGAGMFGGLFGSSFVHRVRKVRSNKWSGPLPSNLRQLTCVQLRTELKSRGLPTHGLKAALIGRLKADIDAKANAAQNG